MTKPSPETLTLLLNFFDGLIIFAVICMIILFCWASPTYNSGKYLPDSDSKESESNKETSR